LAIVAADGNVLVWDVQADRKLASLSMVPVQDDDFTPPNCTFHARGIVFTPDGENILAFCNNSLRVWAVDSL
jgi:WD40 repeat protein